jgi:peroxiredoxin
MKRVVALVAACFGALVSCTHPATETTVSQLAAPAATAAKDAASSPPQTGEAAPQTHEVRKEVAATTGDAKAAEAPGTPKVYLTSEHSALCRVRVGDPLPAINLSQVGGGGAELAKLQGKQATVVLFWGDDPWMSRTALGDLAMIGASDDVAIVGIAVKLPNNEVQSVTEKADVRFPILLDADGKAFNQVGMTKLPRVYVLNQAGEIVWFDIEYSQSTQRELKQTLAVLAGE